MKKLLIILCGVFLIFGMAGSAGAYITIVDDDAYWPTWDNNTSDDDFIPNDQIGGPRVDELRVHLVSGGGGYVDYIEVLMSDPSSTNNAAYPHFLPGLFIDFYVDGGDNDWDYYVKTFSNTSATLYDVSTLNVPVENTTTANEPTTGGYVNYVYSKWTGGPGSFREYHPAGITNVNSSMEVKKDTPSGPVSGLEDYGYTPDLTDPPMGILLFDFRNDLIDFSIAPWQIGFTEVCANDVVFGGGAPVPEPATMLLLGTGLLGLAGIGRKRFFKKS